MSILKITGWRLYSIIQKKIFVYYGSRNEENILTVKSFPFKVQKLINIKLITNKFQIIKNIWFISAILSLKDFQDLVPTLELQYFASIFFLQMSSNNSILNTAVTTESPNPNPSMNFHWIFLFIPLGEQVPYKGSREFNVYVCYSTFILFFFILMK